MALLDILTFKPCKSKSFAYVTCGITAVLFFIYSVMESLGTGDLGYITQALFIAILFAVVGICVHDDNKSGVLGAITMLMGYFMLAFIEAGFYYITCVGDAGTFDKIWYIAMFVASVSYSLGTLAYLLGKFVGYKRDLMSAIGTRVNVITFLAMLVLAVISLFTPWIRAELFAWYLSLAFVPIACLSSAGLAEHLHNKSEK